MSPVTRPYTGPLVRYFDDGPHSSSLPTTSAECDHGPSTRGDDLQLDTGLHWLAEERGYDEAGDLFVCVAPDIGGTVAVTGPSGVSVTPAEQEVDRSGDGILRFEVRVDPGASGDLTARTVSGDTSSTLFGPDIETGDDSWTFAEPE